MVSFLVTGGCGFIGSHLADSLVADGHRVRVLDNLSSGRRENLPPGVELVIGDVADGQLAAECMAGMDACFHLAAVASVERSAEAWLESHRSNLTGAIAIFDAARQRPKDPAPVIFASSAAVYGDPSEMPLKETSKTRPLTPYGADKLGCELHGRVAASMFGVPVTALRFFNVYGPRQDPHSPYSGVISIFSDCVVNERPITIHGDGLQFRDFVYVSDVVRFLRAAMMHTSLPRFEVFNVCTGRKVTLLQLIATLIEVSGKSVVKQCVGARGGDIRASIGDPSAAYAALGLSAQTNIREGIQYLLANTVL